MRATAWLLCAVLILVCGCAATAGDQKIAGAEERPGIGFEPDEYAVVSALIDSQYAQDYQLIVINPRTEPWCIHTQLNILREQWSDLKQETIDSLIVRNGREAALEGRFSIMSEYRFLPEQEYREVLREALAPDWDHFDSTFVDAQGYLTVSRAGFDADRTQALIYYSNAYRCSGSRIHPATRNIAFLKKTGGAWELIGIVRGLHALY